MVHLACCCYPFPPFDGRCCYVFFCFFCTFAYCFNCFGAFVFILFKTFFALYNVVPYLDRTMKLFYTQLSCKHWMVEARGLAKIIQLHILWCDIEENNEPPASLCTHSTNLKVITQQAVMKPFNCKWLSQAKLCAHTHTRTPNWRKI